MGYGTRLILGSGRTGSHSALAVSGHRVEHKGDALVLLVSLVRATPDLRGDFDIVIDIPPGVNRVLFGEPRAEIWRR